MIALMTDGCIACLSTLKYFVMQGVVKEANSGERPMGVFVSGL